MKKMEYQNVKGTQDFLPKEAANRRKIKNTLEETFIQYGCKPLETPILNYTGLMASKYGGGAEILQEMYTLTDRGERDLALRYDLTIPFAKVVAMNPTLRMPFKRYEIGKVFRDGPIKTGRLREFTQCDVDIVGVESQIAEGELMQMAHDAFDKLDLNVTIQYNNRKLLIGMLELFEVPKEFLNQVVLILDKLEKIGVKAVCDQLAELNLKPESITAVESFLTNQNNKTLNYYESFANQNMNIRAGLAELSELESYLKYLAIDAGCVFNPFLARGLEIYTGTVYEIFLNEQQITSSIGSGGRYDNAIGGLIGSDARFSTVGISFGLDVIYTALNLLGRNSDNASDIDFYVIPLKAQKEALRVASSLRQQGYSVDMELSPKKIGKALDKANKEAVRQVVIIGEEGVKNNVYKVKDMVTGVERVEAFDYSSGL